MTLLRIFEDEDVSLLRWVGRLVEAVLVLR